MPLHPGLLDGPPDSLVFDIKVAVCGRSASGKTCLIDVLCGQAASMKYTETVGICVKQATFEIKESPGNEKFVRYNFWEAGHRHAQMFSHMLPHCLEDADVQVHVLSMTDRAGFEELIQQLKKGDPAENRIIVATRQDNVAGWAVAPQELSKLAQQNQAALCLVANDVAMKQEDDCPEFVPEVYASIQHACKKLSEVTVQYPSPELPVSRESIRNQKAFSRVNSILFHNYEEEEADNGVCDGRSIAALKSSAQE